MLVLESESVTLETPENQKHQHLTLVLYRIYRKICIYSLKTKHLLRIRRQFCTATSNELCYDSLCWYDYNFTGDSILKNQTELNNKWILKKWNSHRTSDCESACGSVSDLLTVQQWSSQIFPSVIFNQGTLAWVPRDSCLSDLAPSIQLFLQKCTQMVEKGSRGYIDSGVDLGLPSVACAQLCRTDFISDFIFSNFNCCLFLF